MNEELKILIKAEVDNALKNIKNVSKELKNIQTQGTKSGKSLGDSLKAISKKAAIVLASIVAVVAAVIKLGEKSLEHSKNIAKLNTAFVSMGSTSKQATTSYNNLYRFLGDSDKATEAAAHLAKLTTNEKELAEWTMTLQGVYATFGDSLPIEGLTEAANETARVGKVTGVMADALNWAGVSEDEFNNKLIALMTIEEREELIRTTLNDLYENAANIYEKTNKAALDYNESQAKLDSTMSKAGQAVIPLKTALNNLASTFFTALKPALDAILPPITSFVNKLAEAITSVLAFLGIISDTNTSIKTVSSGLNNASDGANSLSKGLSKAANNAEKIKRTTQGFDELNIISSSNGSNSDSGDTSNYVNTSDIGSFAVEIEETENKVSIFSKAIDKVKSAIDGLKEVFAPAVSGWESAWDSIKKSFDNSKPNIINGFKSLGNGLVNLSNEFADCSTNIINSFGSNVLPVLGDTIGFYIEESVKQFEWLGSLINNVIKDVVVPVLHFVQGVLTDVFAIVGEAWQKHGAPLLAVLSETFEKIRGHLENFYNNVFKPIWDSLIEALNFIWKEALKPLFEKVVDAFLTISKELLILYNEVISPVVDWLITNILPIVVKVVKGVIDTAKKMLTAITKIIGGVIDVIKGIVQFIVGVFTGDWSKAWDGIKNIFKGFADIFTGIIDRIKETLKGIANFIKDVVAARFKIAWEIIKKVWEVAGNFFKGIWNSISAAFDNVGNWFKEKFTQAWNGVKNAWNGAGSFFSGIWNNITKVFGNVGGWFKTKFTEAWTNIKNVFSGWGSFFSGLWDRISNTFSKLGVNIGNAISDAVKSGINSVISLIEKTINSAIKLINGAIDLINLIPGVNIKNIKQLSLPKLAKGGIIDSATIAMIGERGKEAVIPLENNTEWMDKLADRINSRNNTASKIVLMIDGKELGWATINNINSITKQTGNLQLQII